jgi:predicted nucleic acid-binding protein
VTRVALDSNILIYLAGVRRDEADRAKIVRSRDLLRAVKGRARVVVPMQALGEVYTVATTKAGLSREAGRDLVLRFARRFAVAEGGHATLLSALDLAAGHQLQFWDALILTTAAEAECVALLTEDMHQGLIWRGTKIVNPFAATPDPLLTELTREL